MPKLLLSRENTDAVGEVLRQANLLSPDERVTKLSIPGDGNMNFTLRAETTNGQSFIIKQARDYVEKYPSIPAPVERSTVEARFYEAVQSDVVLRSHTPSLLYHDEPNAILVIEDLGLAADFTYLYERDQELDIKVLGELTRFLNVLHLTFPRTAEHNLLKNMEMRELNAEHIFRFPFAADNGFDLDTITPGLEAVANDFRKDDRLLSVAQDLQAVYLNEGDTLIHGDYYPGSWLMTVDGPRIIDPEFGFVGPKEFDLAVMTAHLIMADQSDSIIELANTMYQPVDLFDPVLCRRFTGIEIFRRLIGLAQLPLKAKLEEKTELLNEAYEMAVG